MHHKRLVELSEVLSFKEKVYRQVSRIPKGKVMTYGQIAAICGKPRAAQLVGQIAHFGSEELPWHRVVNRYGSMASGYWGGKEVHAKHLAEEGVVIKDYKIVEIEKYLYLAPSTQHPAPREKGQGTRNKEQTGNGTKEQGTKNSSKRQVESDKRGADASNIRYTTYDIRHTDQPPLIVIVGPTASGKSALAMKIAGKFNGEIISADSRAIYRGLNIATAKPSRTDQDAVKHHLIDVVNPDEQFSAADFKRLANLAIQDITNRGKLPIVVGGTGLYIDSLLYDFPFSKRTTSFNRDELNKLSIAKLAEKVVKAGGAGIDLKNPRRMIRYLETGGTDQTRSRLRGNTLIIGIAKPKSVLDKQIVTRVRQMFHSGLVNEVELIAKQFGWDNEALSGKAFEIIRQFSDQQINAKEAERLLILSHKQLAKRQLTWFKRNKNIRWIKDNRQIKREIELWMSSK